MFHPLTVRYGIRQSKGYDHRKIHKSAGGYVVGENIFTVIRTPIINGMMSNPTPKAIKTRFIFDDCGHCSLMLEAN
jgi:hypothetical protein